VGFKKISHTPIIKEAKRESPDKGGGENKGKKKKKPEAKGPNLRGPVVE